MFKGYLKSMGWLPAILVLVFFTLDQATSLTASVWLSKWSDDKRTANDTALQNMYMGVYASFGVANGE